MYSYSSLSSQQLSSLLDQKKDAAVFMLGKELSFNNDTTATKEEVLRAHFQQLLWLTYRSQFKAISSTNYQTDAGWGCMLRASQMLLANTLARHYSLADASNASTSLQNMENAELKRKILKWFEDKSEAPYSIHRIALNGQRYGKNVGQWFGPQVACDVLKDVVNDHKAINDIVVYVATDATIYRDELDNVCANADVDACLILVPNRLGLDTINEMYLKQIEIILQSPFSIGIIGGRTNAARYFVGSVDSDVLYLDPHFVQPFVPMDGDFDLKSFHTTDVSLMKLCNIDPSLAFAFYCRTRHERQLLLSSLSTAHLLSSANDFPSLAVADHKPTYAQRDQAELVTFDLDDVQQSQQAVDDFEML